MNSPTPSSIMKPISLPEKSFQATTTNTSTTTATGLYNGGYSPDMKKNHHRNDDHNGIDAGHDNNPADYAADDGFQSERSNRNMNLSLEQQQELLNLSKVIRIEESARMKYEDERRKLLLSVKTNHLPTRQQQASLKAPASYRSSSSSSSSSPIVSNLLNQYRHNDDNNNDEFEHINDEDLSSYTSPLNDSPSKRGFMNASYLNGKSPVTKRGGAGGGKVMPSPAEVDTAYKWLNFPRPLVLVDRVPKNYVFRVVLLPDLFNTGYDYESKVESSRGHVVTSKSYNLEWMREEQQTNVTAAADGCVLLEHIKQVSVSDMAREEFIVQVVCSTKALKNSNGRTTVIIRCDSIGASAKYVSSLNTMLRSYQ